MPKSHLVHVIAAIVDEQQLTLYKEDGSTIIILQGDARLAKIIQVITPILANGPGSVAEVDLSEDKEPSPYQDFEKQSEGKVSFFKVAKSKLAGWFSKAAEAVVDPLPPAPPVPAQVIGKLPMPVIPTFPSKAEHLLSVAQEIIKHAQPVASPEFHEQDIGDKGDSTIVAVVGNKVIGGVEKLKPQFTRAVANGGSKGMTAFMQRITTVADKRRHSADDLLKFLERGDLPIADDGSFIIYKVLKRKYQSKEHYVDCHSGNVTQRVGSYVCMDEALVDPNRSNECSNGLHVARRAYVGGFSGDVCVLAKVHPEDVIAVPNHDANKMRVCGYHILFELTDEAFRKLKSNQAFTDNEDAQLLLGRALSGDHAEPIEEVRITAGHGGGLKITPWVNLGKAEAAIETVKPVKAEAPTVAPATKRAEAVAKEPSWKKNFAKKKVEALPDLVDDKVSAPKVDPKAVVKQVTAAKAEAETRSAKAKRLYAEFQKGGTKAFQQDKAKDLLDFKKATKLGWQALGLPADTGEVLQRILA